MYENINRGKNMGQVIVRKRTSFIRDSIMCLVLGLIVFGIAYLVKTWWVHDLFSRGIFAAIVFPFFFFAIMRFIGGFLASYGGILGFVCFCICGGITILLGSLFLIIAINTKNEPLMYLVMSAPIIMLGTCDDHEETDENKANTYGTLGMAGLALVVELILGIMALFINPSVMWVIYYIVLSLGFVVLLATRIPKYIKEGELPWANETDYREEKSGGGSSGGGGHASELSWCIRDAVATGLKSVDVSKAGSRYIIKLHLYAGADANYVIDMARAQCDYINEKYGENNSFSIKYDCR